MHRLHGCKNVADNETVHIVSVPPVAFFGKASAKVSGLFGKFVGPAAYYVGQLTFRLNDMGRAAASILKTV
jgi:hypothetical protein